ncbi:MAG: sulfotransferase, partial [Gammaproteobacteria bacterium]|nr:sulfotransferase [Gammaproteobacteria bacterium]
LGSVLQAAGKLTSAAAAYAAALERNAMHERALTGLAVLLDLEGRYEQGLELTARLADQAAAGPELKLAHARLLRHAGQSRQAIQRLQALLEAPGLHRRAEQHTRFALAGVLDAEGRYAEAFAEAGRANALEPPAFDAAGCRDFVAQSMRCYDRAAMARLPRSSVRSDRPVFIVGMPRSGTTLVEQILAAHPAVYGAGERNDILWLVEELAQRAQSTTPPHRGGVKGRGDYAAYLDIAADLEVADLDLFAERYLAGTPDAAGARRITDKMPSNFRHLGLIDRILPGARVIHCRRNPLDTGLSCFLHGFSGSELAFASDLGNIAIYYRAYRHLMNHWREVLALPMLEIDYEKLIDNLEGESRRMLEFVGLEWDSRCLRFHELVRVVNTASQAQVRRSLYRSSVGRHRHYARELEPLAEALKMPPPPATSADGRGEE